MKKLDDFIWFWQNTILSDHQNKIIDAVAKEADDETLKWFWQKIILSDHQNKIIDAVATRADDETLKWFWQKIILSDHQNKIIDAVATRADDETLKWFWQKIILSDHKNKIIDGVATRADDETLKWFWQNTILSNHKNKIIDGVATRADDEILKWFWQNTILSNHQNKIIDAINKTRVNQYNRTIQKSEQLIAQGGGNSITNSFTHDVFICHASEDKESFVSILAEKLQNKGFKVWYDDYTLLLGDGLRRKIDHGLSHSRYGVVVLSKKFFEKEWPQKELDGLIAREEGLDKVILPIWHGITKREVRDFSPILADRLAVSSDKGIDHVVNEIVKVFKKISI